MSPLDSGTTQPTRSTQARKAGAQPDSWRNLRGESDRATLYRGICSNCENLETCSYPSTISETWFCEEYSVKKPDEQIRLVEDPVEEPEVQDTKLGLCVNCERRKTCTLPKAEGGVWFCNEYE